MYVQRELQRQWVHTHIESLLGGLVVCGWGCTVTTQKHGTKTSRALAARGRHESSSISPCHISGGVGDRPVPSVWPTACQRPCAFQLVQIEARSKPRFMLTHVVSIARGFKSLEKCIGASCGYASAVDCIGAEEDGKIGIKGDDMTTDTRPFGRHMLVGSTWCMHT